ncbi:hypothetical protein GGTG_08559 [Gaeumannomyces tritici R3-111a-1]|uniref:Glycoside hydrolase n=1 Tax=Gaeumannomyces tritici (strain R3-111a-1) TaxID=644352 RepID=J3P4X3_GAET3|nr:hypothetical protein GGTG_08559 [Gaeumannomyces tritici R3-111a-1]EJT74721.1 hypothetical protein GGTG_08559 [Gaeumannomyces tritici R3-111a-1]
MAVQIDQGILGVAVGVLVYSFICLSAGLLMIVLVWARQERTSYVACLSFLTSISTTASIIQQFHTIVDWENIAMAKFDRVLADPRNPELSISGASVGVDLVLFYIQYYSYNAMAMMTLFWAFELAASVFKWTDLRGKRSSLICKTTAFLLPALQMGILRLRATQKIEALFYIIANIIMAISLSSGAVLLMLILFKYIRVRMAFMSWHVGYGEASSPTSQATDLSRSLPVTVAPRQSIHDNWLMVRFTIAFVALAIFEVLTIHFETVTSAANANIAAGTPDLSADALKQVVLLFMPGVSASLLVFVVFGTTKTLREYMWAKVVPRRIREQREAARANRLPSVVFPRGVDGGFVADQHQMALLDSHQRRDSNDRSDNGYGYDQETNTGGGYPHLPPITSGGDLSDVERAITKSGRTSTRITKPPSVIVPGGRPTRGSRRGSKR